jgi:TonB family protein
MTGRGRMKLGGALVLLGIGFTIVSPSLAGGFFVASAFFIGAVIEFMKGLHQAEAEDEALGITSSSVAHPARLTSGGISPEDYPAAAVRAGMQGKVTAAFTVAPDGSARNVRILESSGFEPLDWATCELIAHRFKFAPARDRNMNPVPQERQYSVTWELPAD